MLLRAWPEIRSANGCDAQASAAPIRWPCGSSSRRLRVPDDGIEVLGFLPQDELTDLLRSAKALVAPSLGGESFGMVLTRAFACALPVVASDITGYRDVMTPETAVAVPPGDPARSRTPSPRSSRTSLGALAMAAAARLLAQERYAWPDIARRLLAIYEGSWTAARPAAAARQAVTA